MTQVNVAGSRSARNGEPGAGVSSARAARPARGAGPRWSFGSAAVAVGAALLAVVWLIPLAWALSTSLKPEAETTRIPLSLLPSTVTVDAYTSVLSNGDIVRWFWNSTVVSVLVTVLTLVVSVLAAYGFSRTRFPGRSVLFAIVVAGILVPPQVLIVPLFDEMVTLGLVDTYWGIALPQVVAPIMVFILKKFFDGVSRDYEDAARVDGASRLRIVWSVILPMSKPILVAVAIFTFIQAWNNFLWPFIVTTDPQMMTIPVGLANVQGSYGLRYAQVMASAVLGGLPLLVVYALFQRHVIRGVGDAGIKG
ncbi:carbohydrate ABC transporter membrane protein 2 (CUT1 family) [Haloactinopolyspora alba]|uniref:Carbohydrate ABC transporter membrane protein 2 (CUT1 family) n=1 Tax=Haloactinopolyspora alba TaxID=648780 RepID=A0A2P8E709_9ACTN|nr:carbohydrate ABC transporter permease [Haloactinopolyspora alba]PSL05228.1 carbohydrate ABC transporter membrane protein 2 (CUT1 family) [Haloactinopolyspora alba]